MLETITDFNLTTLELNKKGPRMLRIGTTCGIIVHILFIFGCNVFNENS